MKNFYDARGEDGFFYAYLCPGMNKVLQSAGRVIRTEADEGVILLLDERFAAARYRNLFPAEWQAPQTCTLQTVQGILQSSGVSDRRNHDFSKRNLSDTLACVKIRIDDGKLPNHQNRRIQQEPGGLE